MTLLNILHLFLTPSFLSPGDTAKQIAPLPLDGSATTRFEVMGSSPLSTHSTEAKKDFKLGYFETLRKN